MNYSRYLKSSGRIDALYDFPSEEAMQLNITATHDFIEGVYDQNTQYVDGEMIADRPVSSATQNKSSISADGLDEYIVSNIKQGSSVELLGPVLDQWTETTDTVSLTVNVPGVYRIVVNQFPMQDFEGKFNAS